MFGKKVNRLDIPVYQGAASPLKRPFVSAQDTHGMDGLGETYFPRTSKNPSTSAFRC